MKKNDFNLKNVIAIAICLCSLSVFAGLALTNAISAENQPVAELSFIYTRQAGSGSNQFAVWIEDNKGRYITTLYATGFTANGGWERRETSIPVWVRQSGIAGMEKTRIDAITGATPSAGSLTYRWDGTDSRGVALPSGRYVICLEGTLRGDNQIICRAPIQTGRRRPAEAKVSIEYIGTPPGTERDMISNVTARTLR
jgi:hypothetical protein